MTTIKGVLFDKDGTLIDFTATWRDVIDDLAAEVSGGDEALAADMCAAIGYDVKTGVFLPGSPIVAGSVDVIASLIAELAPRHSAVEIEDIANRAALSMGADDLAPAPGLKQCIAWLQAQGVKLGVATHDGEDAARANLKTLGVFEAFDFIAGYDSGHGHKPGPGMPQAFAAHIGAAIEEVVMVGDSVHDLGAGNAAGCRYSVGVLTGPATEAELGPLADIVLPSIADLPDFLSRAAT
ncbi:MAG: HAD family hydrolase [Pseudomonadota bacterium]